jgi:AAA domain (dynein-related subfamily)
VADWLQALDAGIPVLLWGPPGVGKTAAVAAAAKARGAHLETLIGSTLDPSDICRQMLIGEKLELLAPGWARRLHETLAKGGEAWLFLDELTCSPPSVKAALLRVVNELRVGELSLDGLKIIAAANPTEQAADGYELDHATANRWCHLDWRLDAEDWIAGELGNWGSPSVEGAQQRALVTGWIGHNPSALLVAPKDGNELRGWPSPRSWSRVARLPTDAPLSLISGLVGKGAASEYITWRNSQDLPNTLDVIEGRASVPERGDKAYVVLGACVALVIAKPDLLPKFWKLLVKQRKDHALVAARRALKALKTAGIEYLVTPELTAITKMVQR